MLKDLDGACLDWEKGKIMGNADAEKMLKDICKK